MDDTSLTESAMTVLSCPPESRTMDTLHRNLLPLYSAVESPKLSPIALMQIHLIAAPTRRRNRCIC